MFTGIIEEKGSVVSLSKKSGFSRIEIQAELVLEGSKEGDSICVDGVCLTITEISNGSFTADIMSESMKATALRLLHTKSPVNLERALSPLSRMGGHFVSGHVDTIGTVSSLKTEGNATIMTIRLPKTYSHYLAPKGSVAVHGASLTIITHSDTSFSVGIIPHTATKTTLTEKKIGEGLNIEFDILAKYIHQQFHGRK